MPRILHLGGLLLACLTCLVADQKNADPHGSPPPRPAQDRPPNGGARWGGTPRTPKQPMGPPLSNPASPVARLYRATPEERDRALEKLPLKMQQQLRTQLERFDAMPKEQQQVFIRRAERFAALSAEQQAAVVQQLRALNQLPPERQSAIRIALRRLQPMSEEERRNVVNGDEFKNRFSAGEQKIIADLSEVMMPPM